MVAEIPGTIEAENFDTGAEGMSFHDSDSKDEGDGKYRTNGGGVDIVKGNGGFAIGYTSSGEWLEYTVDVKEAGTYAFDAVVSSGANNSSFSLSLNTAEGISDLTGSIAVPCITSNDWNTYSTVHGRLSLPLEAGRQIIRINIMGANCNIDKIKLQRIDVDENIKVAIAADPEPATVSEPTTIAVDASSATSTIAKVNVYVNDVLLKAIDAVDTEWASPLAAFEATYKHEQHVTSLINNLMHIAVEEKDFAAQSRLQWFIDEQVEEEENAVEIINKLKMLDGNSYGLYVLDQELAARVYATPSPLAAKA
jgi:hypothetical protein